MVMFTSCFRILNIMYKMIIAANLVLLFKAQKGNETENKYEDVLHKNGFKTEQLKSIDFNFINLDKLQEKLMNPDAYQGIIFSSPRCVEGVAKALKRSKLNTEWKNKHNYVVGEMTYKCAFEDLGLDCMGKDSGNGEKLSAIIIKDVSMQDSRPFLMPCGNLKTDTIETRLNEFKIPTEAVTVYETITNPNFAREFSNVTDDFEKIPEFMVFFSPSGVKAFSNCLAGKFKHYLNSIKFISIGPTTSKAILDAGLPIYGVAKKPNPEELLKAIQQNEMQ